MVVQTLDRYPGHTGRLGLHVGSVNVEQYFSSQMESVELQLDHLCIECALEPSFWGDRPEIHDMRLSIWLEAKRSSGKIAATPASMAMIPIGPHVFRLQVMSKEEASQQLPSPVIAFDRRKRSIAHHPERRRIGKLKGNDSSASAASH